MRQAVPAHAPAGHAARIDANVASAILWSAYRKTPESSASSAAATRRRVRRVAHRVGTSRRDSGSDRAATRAPRPTTELTLAAAGLGQATPPAAPGPRAADRWR